MELVNNWIKEDDEKMDEIKQFLEDEIERLEKEGKDTQEIYRLIGKKIQEKLGSGEYNSEQAIEAVDYMANFFRKEEPEETRKKNEKIDLELENIIRFYKNGKYESIEQLEEAAEDYIEIRIKSGKFTEEESEQLIERLRETVELIKRYGLQTNDGQEIADDLIKGETPGEQPDGEDR